MNYQFHDGGVWCDSPQTEISIVHRTIRQQVAPFLVVRDLSDETRRRLGFYWFGALNFRWFNSRPGLQPSAKFVFSLPSRDVVSVVTPLEEFFTVHEATQVHSWLASHPSVATLLDEVRAPLREIFPDAIFRLAVVPDPEAPRDELVLSVVTKMDALESLDAMDEFDRRWWLKNMQRATGELQIVLDWA